MVSNQTEFDLKYPKELKEIEFKREKKFTGQLVIEGYPALENLNLRDISSINKLTLENLPQLKQCTIWNCGVKKLMIENCSQLKELNIRKNLLTDLGFLANLETLEALEIVGNTKLTEILKPYNGDWKAYRIVELAKQNPQKLLKIISDLREKNKELKEEIEKNTSSQSISIDNPIDFQKKHQKLKEVLSYLLQQEEIKTGELSNLLEEENPNKINSNIVTKDLIESLSTLKKTNQKFKKQLDEFEQLLLTKKQEISKKEEELEKLKSKLLEKTGNYNKEKLQKKLIKLLKFQVDITTFNALSAIEEKEEIKEELVEETLITNEELNNFCQLQSEITQLKLEIQKNFNQINQTFINNQTINQQIKNIQGFNIEGSHNTFTNPSVQGNTLETITYEEETELQATIEAPPLKQLEQ